MYSKSIGENNFGIFFLIVIVLIRKYLTRICIEILTCIYIGYDALLFLYLASFTVHVWEIFDTKLYLNI